VADKRSGNTIRLPSEMTDDSSGVLDSLSVMVLCGTMRRYASPYPSASLAVVISARLHLGPLSYPEASASAEDRDELATRLHGPPSIT
jgi:hypothetical protein